MGISLYIFQQHLDHFLVETEGKRIQHKNEVEKDNETGENT